MELTDYRAQIDALDLQLTDLFRQRMALCAAIGTYKRAHELPIFQPEREAQKLRVLEQAVPEELRGELRALYALLFALSRAKQEEE